MIHTTSKLGLQKEQSTFKRVLIFWTLLDFPSLYEICFTMSHFMAKASSHVYFKHPEVWTLASNFLKHDEAAQHYCQGLSSGNSKKELGVYQDIL